MRRCESVTTKGTRCRKEAVVYHLHSDGLEYLTCSAHHREGFTPCQSVTGRRGSYFKDCV
jgi:hypothetical protein